VDDKEITPNSVYFVEQFAKINITLGYLKETMDKQSRREDNQDKAIEQLMRDISEMKSDIRSLKEAKPKKAPGLVVLTAVIASAAFGLSLLNQLYGGVA
jgi:hypothetical protein